MKEIYYTNSFKKDLKKVKSYPSFKSDKLKHFVELLANNEQLPATAKNHKLSSVSPKHLQGMWDFHVAPDICVVYKVDDSSVSLIRIGKHNQLGLTEDISL